MTRRHYHNGSIVKEIRKNGQELWTLRWREPDATAG
jgi:hypothetical protein